MEALLILLPKTPEGQPHTYLFIVSPPPLASWGICHLVSVQLARSSWFIRPREYEP